MVAANISQPMIYPAVHRCAQYIACPSEKLWKMLLKNLKMYPSDGIVFQRHKISDTKYTKVTSEKGRPNLTTTYHPLLYGEVDASLKRLSQG